MRPVKVASTDPPRIRARASAEQLASRGHQRGAIAILERWTSGAPEDLYARVRLVELLREANRTQAAENEGRRSLEVVDDPLLRAHLIDVLRAPAASAQ